MVGTYFVILLGYKLACLLPFYISINAIYFPLSSARSSWRSCTPMLTHFGSCLMLKDGEDVVFQESSMT